MERILLLVALLVALTPLSAKKMSVKKIATQPVSYYGKGLCDYPQYECIKVRGGENWTKLFPDPVQRDLVQRLNRTYNYIGSDKTIVVPRNLSRVNLFDISPFALKIAASRDKQIIVDQDKLAWAAYNENGQLVKWGPISSGSDKCSDSAKSCRTLTGIFMIFSKENQHCISNAFPAGKGGAQMPYCMFFHKGFALHGSDDIPGERASHGCVRLFIEDAKWLNKEFVNVSNETNNYAGTVVIVRPLANAEQQGTIVAGQGKDDEERPRPTGPRKRR